MLWFFLKKLPIFWITAQLLLSKTVIMGPRLISLGVTQMNNSQVVFYLPDKSAGCHGSVNKTYLAFQSIQFYKRNGGRIPNSDRCESIYHLIGQNFLRALTRPSCIAFHNQRRCDLHRLCRLNLHGQVSKHLDFPLPVQPIHFNKKGACFTIFLSLGQKVESDV